jgi:hypothetical protein
MKQFEESRDTKTRELFEKMKQERNNTEDPMSMVNQYQTNVPKVPITSAIPVDKFNINQFNQLFELNKYSQCTKLEPYCDDIKGHCKTDLSAIEPELDLDLAENKLDFMTINLNDTLCTDVSITPVERKYEDPSILLKQMMTEREGSIVPEEVKLDNDPLSYDDICCDP